MAHTETKPEATNETADFTLEKFRRHLNANFFEREDEIECILTALIAGEHVLLLGPPGTAKSALVNAVSQALGGTLFKLLMTTFTTPDEVVGPISLKGIEHDMYRRVTSGYLPEADVAFLDEIFKANSPILNALLTALNERQFDNGGQRQKIPLQVCIGASNELPQDESLRALYDRFMLRCWVTGLKSGDSFRSLLASGGVGADAYLDPALPGAIEYMRGNRCNVDIEPVINSICNIRDALAAEADIEVSDRRWVKALSLVQAQAVMDGRLVADAMDLMILQHALWDDPEDAAKVRRIISSNLDRNMTKALKLRDAAMESYNQINFDDESSFLHNGGTANSILKRAIEEVQKMDQSPQIQTVLQELQAAQKILATKIQQSLNF